jgi:glycosyltransferase involved in cell wall biosynthesis/predicted metal-dependent phosphoesterase TrpH
MTTADLHIHSTYSKHPAEWFLQRIGTQESYTAIEDVYRIAKERGMSYVTLTDHNTIDGALRLKELYPEDTFISTEITTYFPEDGCKIHVLAYDITKKQFEEISAIRTNIYDLRQYLKSNNIACSVAHATYSVNGKLTIEALEKLILLFDVFEGINGARNQSYNRAWVRALQNLTPAHIDRLFDTYGIEPWSADPWVKGFTGGSDDHAGLFAGETFTLAHDCTLDQFMSSIRNKETFASGRSSNHKSLAFAIYKIAYDFSKERASNNGGGLWYLINSMLFENRPLGWKNWLAVQRMKLKKDSEDRIIVKFFGDLIESCTNNNDLAIDSRIDQIYNNISELADDFLSMIVKSLEKDLKNGDTSKLVKNFSAALPAVFLSAPFFTAIRYLYLDRNLFHELRNRFGRDETDGEKKVLWFSDTVTDLNGVSVTMRSLARSAHEHDRPMKLVTSLPEEEIPADMPPNLLNLPCIHSYAPDFYPTCILRLPSVLKAIDMISEENPDEIVISTPGPVGLVGLLASRLMDVKCTGVYHTDFTRQADYFIGDEWVSNIIETYTRWFYKLMDEIRVPTDQYISILSGRGFDGCNMKVFRRGVDPEFKMVPAEKQEQIRAQYGLDKDDMVLLFAGRVGKEKNIAMLNKIYKAVCKSSSRIQLLVVGDGPELDRMKEEMEGHPGVVFTGRKDRSELPAFFSVSDLFVFPSTTDTFGMVILEAQACGLPAMVTNVGGPQEIVKHGETGYVLPPTDISAWISKVLELTKLKHENPSGYMEMKKKTETLSRREFSWSQVLDEMMGAGRSRRRSRRQFGTDKAGESGIVQEAEEIVAASL